VVVSELGSRETDADIRATVEGIEAVRGVESDPKHHTLWLELEDDATTARHEIVSALESLGYTIERIELS